MMDLETLHSKAMDFAEMAMVAQRRGDASQAAEYLRQAFERESQAARQGVREDAPEPTRSILLKSAAHLAVDVGELREAELFTATALSGDPPEDLAEELRSLFEEIGFHRHLAVRGVELQSNDVQLVLVGHSVAPGMAASRELTTRVDTFQRLLYRGLESDLELEYRERGTPPKEIGEPLQLFVSVPRAASFAVSLKVASEKSQAEFSYAESVQALDQLLARLRMFDEQNFDDLRKAIPKQEYFDNFIDLASQLAPDGDRVRMVGFTTLRDDQEVRFEMRRPTKTDGGGQPFVLPETPQRFYGRVFFVNARDEENPIIKLQTEDDREFRLRAPGDLLEKAVQYAARRSRVAVEGRQTARTVLQVEEIRAVRRPSGFRRSGNSRR